MPRTSKKRKMELILRYDSIKIDTSVVTIGWISPYQAEIITALQMLRDVGDTLTFKLIEDMWFEDDFDEYIKTKRVQDVTFEHFGLHYVGDMLTIRLAKPLIKIK